MGSLSSKLLFCLLVLLCLLSAEEMGHRRDICAPQGAGADLLDVNFLMQVTELLLRGGWMGSRRLAEEMALCLSSQWCRWLQGWPGPPPWGTWVQKGHCVPSKELQP
jgi:hypothetical protein